MAKYRLIGGGGRRSFVTLENKVRAIAEIYLRGKAPRDVLRPLYESANRDLPRNTSIVLASWRKTIQDRLDAQDDLAISLCKQHGVIEEGEPARRGRRGR
jgi:hypothetical protein